MRFDSANHEIKRKQLNPSKITKLQRDYLIKKLEEVNRLESRGESEVVGYNGRVAIIGIGGTWERGNVFYVTSFGYYEENLHIYTKDGGIFIKEK